MATGWTLPALLLIMLTASAAKRIPTFAGPYLVWVERLTMCHVDDATNAIPFLVRISHFNPNRPNEKQNLTGFLDHSASGWDDSWWSRVRMDVRSNNQWKENAFVFNFPRKACSSFRANSPDLFRALYVHALAPDVLSGKAPCFVPTGVNSTFDKEPVDWVYPNVPIMPYGFYRFKKETGPRGGPARYCSYAEVHLIPKTT